MKKKEDNNMAEEFDKKKDSKDSKDNTKETQKKDSTKKEPVDDVIHEEHSSGGETLSQLLSELEKLGIVLPDDTDEKNLAEKLLPAVLTLNAKIAELDAEEGGAGGTKEEGQDLDLDALLGGAAPPAPEQNGGAQDKSEPNTKKAEEVPPTMTMSLDKKRLSLVESKLEETTRKSMYAEIKQLVESGRISPAMAQKLQAEVKKYKLSLNAKGEEAENSVQTLIEYFKMLPANATLDNKTRLSLATEQELPDSFEALNDVEAEELAEQMLKMSGKMGQTYSF